MYVGRPTIFGNPFPLTFGRKRCVKLFKLAVRHRWAQLEREGIGLFDVVSLQIWAKRFSDALPKLRGKDLACWCRLKDADGLPVPCHADVLLEIANET